MRRTDLGLSLGLAAALVAPLGCDRPALEVRFVDLVTEQKLTVDGRRLRPVEIVAVDETWVSVTLAAGSEVRADIELLDEPTLTLAGSLECGDSVDPPMEGDLVGSVRASRGREVGLEIAFDAADGWWRQVVDLDGLANTRSELAVRADIPTGCIVRLREATIRHLRRIPVPESEPKTQVLLVSVDTLRRDGVGSFGGSVVTPSLDRLAEEAERWTTVYAAASWTKPSHASLLTGYYPETHRAILLDQGMDAAVPTLAERFRSAGFATSALVFDCTWLSPRWGFGKGFDSYQVTQWRAGRQARAAAGWVLDHRDKDFFFFLHTFEPHSDFAVLPYEAPGLSQRSIAQKYGVEGFGCRRGLCASRFVNALSDGEVPRRPKDAKILRNSYDMGISYLDASLGELFDALRQSGVWDDLLVVVTSDHGEEFDEHGGFGHSALYDEILRVPLIIKWPRGERAGVVNTSPSSGIDVAPTLLEHAGLPFAGLPGGHLHSRDPDSPILAGTLELAVVAGGFKGVFGGNRPARLYDLTEDPGELVDLASQRPEILEDLRIILADQRDQARALYRSFGSKGNQGTVELGERERERLKAFGYLN
jgi:arylsulfatase A-like enzyme